MVHGHPDNDIRVCYDAECKFCSGMKNEWRCTAGKVILEHEGYKIHLDGEVQRVDKLICLTRAQRDDE